MFFTGLHGLHLVTAIIFPVDCAENATWKYKVHSKNMAQMEKCVQPTGIFLSGLWLYLFVFLLLYR